MEDYIRTGKDTGLGYLPSTSIDINRAWCVATTIACDLLLATAALPRRPVGHRRTQDVTAARIVRGQRKRKIRIPDTWPWTWELATCRLLTALALPPPTRA